jgi:hypothetical protein
MEQLGMDISMPMTLMEDNTAAQQLAETGKRSKRSKHFRVREFWIHSKVEDKTFKIQHIPTGEQLADMLTKPLPKKQFRKLRLAIGIRGPRDLLSEGVIREFGRVRVTQRQTRGLWFRLRFRGDRFATRSGRFGVD